LHKNSNYTIVLIEHDMRVVFNLADRISVLDQGKLLADGTPAEIAADPQVQAAYLGKAE
jgi:branched-chain amino acid transport system ATP-binding protein